MFVFVKLSKPRYQEADWEYDEIFRLIANSASGRLKLVVIRPCIGSQHRAHTGISASAMVRSFRHVDDTERRLVRNMARDRIPWVTIQRITGRSPDTIRSMLNPARTTVPKGAPIKIRGEGCGQGLEGHGEDVEAC